MLKSSWGVDKTDLNDLHPQLGHFRLPELLLDPPQHLPRLVPNLLHQLPLRVIVGNQDLIPWQSLKLPDYSFCGVSCTRKTVIFRNA